jgi:serine/threonine protein kinase
VSGFIGFRRHTEYICDAAWSLHRHRRALVALPQVIDNRSVESSVSQQGGHMICARCQTPNPNQSEVCLGCGASLSSAIDAATIDKLETASLSFDEDFGPRYHVECILGMGGMGRVYRAHDKELDRTVALKILRQDAGDDPLALQRFKQELQLASRITHPNILRIHDLGECRGLKFISMQYVEGGDLLQILRKEGALPLPRAVSIMVQLCEALQAAHSASVVHRDLKPQNILVSESDHVFISDFGLAKSIEPALTGVTRTGAILGTPKYMSPEQVQGKPVDHHTDIYSLGLIFYEILTGTLPFNGDSTYQLMYQRVHELPSRAAKSSNSFVSFSHRPALPRAGSHSSLSKRSGNSSRPPRGPILRVRCVSPAPTRGS